MRLLSRFEDFNRVSVVDRLVRALTDDENAILQDPDPDMDDLLRTVTKHSLTCMMDCGRDCHGKIGLITNGWAT